MSLAGQGPMGVRYCLACTNGIGKGIVWTLDEMKLKPWVGNIYRIRQG